MKDWICGIQDIVHDSLKDPILKNFYCQQVLTKDCLVTIGGIERTTTKLWSCSISLQMMSMKLSCQPKVIQSKNWVLGRMP